MELVAAGLHDHVHHGSGCAAQFWIVIGHRRVHRLDRFDGGNVDLQQAGALVIVRALDHEVVALAHLAVDFGLQRTAGVEELRVLELHGRNSRNQVQQALKIAVDAQGRVFDEILLDLQADSGGIGLQQRRGAGDLDGLRHNAGLQLNVHAGVGIDQHRDIPAQLLLEAGRLDGNRIAAGRQVHKCVIPAVVGLADAGGVGGDFCDGDLRVGNHRTAGVGDGTQQRGIHSLRVSRSGAGQSNQHHGKESLRT